MKKDFQKWNEKKEKIHESADSFFFHEREVWWCSLGINVGYEQDGAKNFIRPIIIFKKFNNRIFWGIPLTTKDKNGKYYYKFAFLNKNNTAILSQLRLLDSKRLVDKMGVMEEGDFLKIKKAINKLTC